jgi:hypothetical protein
LIKLEWIVSQLDSVENNAAQEPVTSTLMIDYQTFTTQHDVQARGTKPWPLLCQFSHPLTNERILHCWSWTSIGSPIQAN